MTADSLKERGKEIERLLRVPGSGSLWGPPITVEAADFIAEALIRITQLEGDVAHLRPLAYDENDVTWKSKYELVEAENTKLNFELDEAWYAMKEDR